MTTTTPQTRRHFLATAGSGLCWRCLRARQSKRRQKSPECQSGPPTVGCENQTSATPSPSLGGMCSPRPAPGWWQRVGPQPMCCGTSLATRRRQQRHGSRRHGPSSIWHAGLSTSTPSTTGFRPLKPQSHGGCQTSQPMLGCLERRRSSHLLRWCRRLGAAKPCPRPGPADSRPPGRWRH